MNATFKTRLDQISLVLVVVTLLAVLLACIKQTPRPAAPKAPAASSLLPVVPRAELMLVEFGDARSPAPIADSGGIAGALASFDDWRSKGECSATFTTRLENFKMYLASRGAVLEGPGTSLVQHIDWTRTDEDRGRGMGCACEHKAGMGLFDSGMDVSTWGLFEWAAVLSGAYMLLSTVLTTKRAASRVAALPGERRKRRAASYRAKAAALTSKKR